MSYASCSSSAATAVQNDGGSEMIWSKLKVVSGSRVVASDCEGFEKTKEGWWKTHREIQIDFSTTLSLVTDRKKRDPGLMFYLIPLHSDP